MTSSVLYHASKGRALTTKTQSRFIDSFLNFFLSLLYSFFGRITVSSTSHVIDTFSIVLRIGIIYLEGHE